MGTLYLVATPIGNLEDITHRALRVLGEVDALGCEDTRVTRKIYERYGLRKPPILFSCHEHNEERTLHRILGLLAVGKSVALCSDGGYPGISDPGYRSVEAAIAEGHTIEVIPGPGAVATALLLSGLPSSSYLFKGFPPRKSGPRQRFLGAEKELPHTLVLFESPHRVVKLLNDALVVLGDRRAAVCVELTKKFERVHRGFLSDLVRELGQTVIRGEVSVVIAGAHPKFVREAVAAPESDEE